MAAFSDDFDFDEVGSADYLPIGPVEPGWIGRTEELPLEVKKRRIQSVCVEIGLGEFTFPELWYESDYNDLYDFLRKEYVYKKEGRQKPLDPALKKSVLYKIVGINLKRRDALLAYYNITDDKDEHSFTHLKQPKPSAFVQFMQFRRLHDRLRHLHQQDLAARRKALGGRTHKRKKTKRAKKRKTYGRL
jgi:hypothetical protein